jgi:prolyl oligopeptidase
MDIKTAGCSTLRISRRARDLQSGYTLRGPRFYDPYLRPERRDDPETRAWIEAQEAVTHAVLRAVLRAVLGRDRLPAAVAPRRATRGGRVD